MPTPYAAMMVKCPFYHKHENSRIVCEGVCKGSTISLIHECAADRRHYMHEHCNDLLGSRDCPIHQMLDQIYEEEYGDG
jgi:hypothetical protein